MTLVSNVPESVLRKATFSLLRTHLNGEGSVLTGATETTARLVFSPRKVNVKVTNWAVCLATGKHRHEHVSMNSSPFRGK